MDVWNLLFVIFQILNLAKAEWNPNTALILVDIPENTPKKFPSDVRRPPESHHTLYFDVWYQNHQSAHTYCPLPNKPPNCNYITSSADINQYWGNTVSPLREICDFPVVFSMEPNRDRHPNLNCVYNNRVGYSYRFIYLLCIDDADSTVEDKIPIYEICYQDHKQYMQTIIGSYEIENPRLLGNVLLRDERNYIFNYFMPPDHNNHLADIIRLYNESDTYLPRAVVPPELSPFAHQRIAFHNFTNSAPMQRNLKPGWELFLKNLSAKASLLNYKIHVVGGLLGVMKNRYNEQIYLGNFHEFPQVQIPKYWWVLIHNSTFELGIVIMMRNQIYREHYSGGPNMVVYDNRYCSKENCYNANLGDAMLSLNEYPSNFIYCCAPIVITRTFAITGTHTDTIMMFPNVQT